MSIPPIVIAGTSPNEEEQGKPNPIAVMNLFNRYLDWCDEQGIDPAPHPSTTATSIASAQDGELR